MVGERRMLFSPPNPREKLRRKVREKRKREISQMDYRKPPNHEDQEKLVKKERGKSDSLPARRLRRKTGSEIGKARESLSQKE